ncbi:MAG: phage baseplate assembly protein V [Jatrophihabitantaceae bacterium]
MTAIGVLAPDVRVNGTSLPANWLIAITGLRVERALCLIARTTLRFADWGYQLSADNKFALGTAVSIAVQGGGELMSGVVTGVSLEQSSSDSPELVVTVDDQGYRLALGTNVRTFLQASYADALSQVMGGAGLSLKNSSTKLAGINDYLLQGGSDLAFLDSITRRAGAVWWVEGGALCIEDVGADKGSVGVVLMEDLTEFSVRASALRPTGVTVTGWDANAQQDVKGENETPGTTATSDFVSAYIGDKPQSLHKSVQSSFDQNPVNASDAGILANAMYNDVVASAVTARGSGLINPAIKLMTKVNVTGAGPASGSYVVSQVEHIFRTDGFYTRFVAGPIRPGGLVDTLGPSAPDPGFEIAGLLTAVVTNLADPDNVGRVKVKYSAAGGAIESAWARIVGLGVGKGRGSEFLPEINDEVLVGFERGDSRHPVVLGGLFSKENKLPSGTAAVTNNEVNFRRITSRLGHVIEMGDGSGESDQHLQLVLAGGEHKLRLGKDRFELEVPARIPVSIKAGDAKFVIDGQGNVTIEGNKITLKATTQVDIEGSAGVALKSDSKVAVQAAMIDVKAEGTASVDGGGMLTLKGGMVAIN